MTSNKYNHKHPFFFDAITTYELLVIDPDVKVPLSPDVDQRLSQLLKRKYMSNRLESIIIVSVIWSKQRLIIMKPGENLFSEVESFKHKLKSEECEEQPCAHDITRV